MRKVPFKFKRGIMCAFLTWHRHFNGVTTKSGPEKYQPFRQLGVCKYCLRDLQGEDLKGTFYEAELQKVTYSPDQTFEVEWELNCRGCGRKQEENQPECHILFHERHQSEGDTTSQTGYREQRMFAI